uniref:Major facilitator superfamily (MFS) profile domain-containing protein n=1 Tax=Strigops habroptila TaxID=2489341 RepID=A0A672U8B5_STRHB
FGFFVGFVYFFLIIILVYVACQSMLIVLVGAVPEYHIHQEEIPANRAELAKRIRFVDNFTSIVTEWYLIEQEAYKVSLASSLYFAGLLIGNATFGPLSDKLGRKPVYISGKIVERLFFTPNYDIFAVSRFFVGIVNGGMALVSFVLTQEYVGKSFWSFTGGIWEYLIFLLLCHVIVLTINTLHFIFVPRLSGCSISQASVM